MQASEMSKHYRIHGPATRHSLWLSEVIFTSLKLFSLWATMPRVLKGSREAIVAFGTVLGTLGASSFTEGAF